MGVPGEDSAPALFEFGTAFLKQEVLGRLDLADRASLLETCRSGRDLVKDAGLDPSTSGRLQLKDFVGSVERLAWARDHGCPMDTTVCATVALHGQLDVLKWAVEQGLPWDALTTAAAAEGGHLDVLKWAREKGCPWLCWTIESAAEHGHLEVLMWARERGCEWSPLACSLAARGGHLQVLRWLRDESVHGKGSVCPWNAWTTEEASKAGHVEVLRWAYQIGGCSINATRCIKRAVENGRLEVLKYLWEQNPDFFDGIAEVWRMAGVCGQIEVLRWLFAVGARPADFSDEVNITAGWGRHKSGFECLRWAYDVAHVPLTSDNIWDAAVGGMFEAMQWLREREVDWADGTTTELAKSGHLELLIWARQNGASWEEETFPCVKYTRGLGRIRRYLRDEGCPGSSSEDPDNADVDWMD